MKKLLHFYIVISVFAFLTMGFQVSAQVKIIVQNDAHVLFIDSGKNLVVKSKETFEINTLEPIWVSESGRLPILIVPIDNKDQVIKLNPPTTRRDGKDTDSVSLDKSLSDLLKQFVEVQKMVAGKNISEALSRTYSLKAKYPEVAFLEFLLASVLVVNGNKKEARNALERGLALHPDYPDGIRMLKNLEEPK